MNTEKAQKVFAADKFARLAGIEIVAAAKGYCKARMKIDPEKHFNIAGVVHGGAVFTLADLAFAVASNSHGTLALAINVHISYLEARQKGILYAEATEVAEPKKLGCYDVVVSDEEGGLVARFHGMVYRKKQEILGLD